MHVFKQNIQKVAVQLATWALLVVAGCVTPFAPDFKEQPTALVVQGFISNEPGPYTIQLVRPANYSFSGYSLGVNNARVFITDESGEGEQLVSTAESGQYKTRTLRGVTGRSYKLTIEVDGKKYESSAELLREAPPIERVYHEEFRDISPITNERRQGGWKVYIDTKDPAEGGNYYRWNALHYKQLVACGYVKDRFGTPINSLNCCTNCWDIVRCLGVNCINIANDALTNGKEIARQEVATVPIGCRDRYYLEVEQQALSRDAYIYWKTVKQLLQNTGGVFDVAPSSVPGNMVCVTDPNEEVLGYFNAIGIERVGYMVDRRNSERVNCPPELPIPEGLPPCAPCVESIYRTGQKPRFWSF